MRKLLFASLSLAVAISLNAGVYATVDGENIDDKDIAALMGGAMGQGSIDKLPKETKEQVINQAIERKLMAKQAKKEGIEKDKEYKEALEKVKDNLMLEVWMKKIYDGIKVTDADIKKFYEDNSAKFMKPKQAKAKHILVKEKKDAEKIIADLRSLKGEKLTAKFEELAKSKSEDKGSAVNGGELGWFGDAQMVKPFSDATFALKKGELTKKPVQTQFGYHIILKEDEKAAEKAKLEEVKAQIEGAIKMEEFRKNVAKKGEELRKKAKIEYK